MTCCDTAADVGRGSRDREGKWNRVESNCVGDGSQVLRVHCRFTTVGMRELFEAADKHRAAPLGKLCQLDGSGVAVPPSGERESQPGVQPSHDHGTTSCQRRHVQVLRSSVRLEIRIRRGRTAALQGGKSHSRMCCLPRSREYR